MDKMRREVENKVTYWTRMTALSCLLCVTNIWRHFVPVEGGESFYEFFQGFQLGLIIVMLVLSIFNLTKFRKMLQSEEQIRAFYIKEHDERESMIREKTGGTVMETCALLIIMAGVIAGYFHPVVFGSLIVCGVFLLVVKKAMCIYYCKKL